MKLKLVWIKSNMRCIETAAVVKLVFEWYVIKSNMRCIETHSH